MSPGITTLKKKPFNHLSDCKTVHGVLAVSLMALAACAPYQYEARPLQTKQVAEQFMSRSLDESGLHDHLLAYGYPVRLWPMQNWDLGALTLAAWYFHPELQVAIAEYKQSKVHAAVINPRINPEVEIPLEYHSDTEGGRSPWTLGLLFNFILERPAKREARQAQAEAEINSATVNINAVAWNIYSQLRRQYINYLATLQTEELLQKQLQLTEEAMQLLRRRLELGQASEFEINTMQLEVQRLRLALTNQKVNVVEARHALAGSMGVPVAALEHQSFNLSRELSFAGGEELNTERLQGIALTQRLDIQQSLADYAAQEATLKLEIEKQYPDLTLSPGFIFDQHDNIWALGSAWILPMFQPQNQGPIQEALALRETRQAEFLALQARVINDVDAAYGRLQAQQTALQEAQTLLAEVEERSRQMQRQYELGYADHLQISRNLLEAAAVKQAVSDLEFSVLRARSQLEDSLHYPLYSELAYRFLFNGAEPTSISDPE